MSDGTDKVLRRWTLEQVFGQSLKSDELRGPWIEASDHDRIVAELRAEVEELRKSECLPFDAYYKTCEVHTGLLEEELKEARTNIATQAREAEVLKDVIGKLKLQRMDLLNSKFAGFPLKVMDKEAELDAELAAITKFEKEGAKDE